MQKLFKAGIWLNNTLKIASAIIIRLFTICVMLDFATKCIFFLILSFPNLLSLFHLGENRRKCFA